MSSRAWGSRARPPSDGVLRSLDAPNAPQPPANAIRRGHEITGVTRERGMGGAGKNFGLKGEDELGTGPGESGGFCGGWRGVC